MEKRFLSLDEFINESKKLTPEEMCPKTGPTMAAALKTGLHAKFIRFTKLTASNPWCAVRMDYSFQPTIAKFKEVGEFVFVINMSTKEIRFGINVDEWESFPISDYIKDNKFELIGTYTTLDEIINICKSTYKRKLKEEQTRFNASKSNDINV
ncbi:MAG: hypothetical protein WC979_00535 [Candidatus Pacearchaeota archaeon]|jgi:hypothetical protein|nr:hypothetical protein [Clostridia bacterium]